MQLGGKSAEKEKEKLVGGKSHTLIFLIVGVSKAISGVPSTCVTYIPAWGSGQTFPHLLDNSPENKNSHLSR